MEIKKAQNANDAVRLIFLALVVMTSLSAMAGMQSTGQTDATSIGGVAISTGTGVSGPGTQRVVLASDSPTGLTDAQLRASAVPISAASLPLPDGAATSAIQTTGNTSLSSIDGKLNSLTIVISSGVVTSTGATVALTAPGHSSGAVQISGTWVGQFEFEATVNGTDWLSRDVRGPSILMNATATNNIFTFPIGPFASFRVRSSSLISGSASVFFRASAGNYYPQ